MAHTSLVLLFLLSVAVSAALDPCANPMYLYDNGDRNPGCSPDSKPLADCTLREGWYKVVNLTGPLNMTSHTPLGPGCGTKHPIWLKGAHPSPTDGVVNRSACVWSRYNPCHSSYQIKVRNCSSYLVYYLTKTKYDERYCFDSNMTCEGADLDNKHYHPVFLSYSTKFGCMMFLGGLLIGALVVTTAVMVKARKHKLAGTSRAVRREPALNNNLPPSYNECVGSASTAKY